MQDHLTVTFAALADPTRRAMLARLAQSAATVTELAEPFALALPTVSRHLKVLESAGLITRGKSAQFRPCALNAAPLEAADTWLATYREFFSQRFDALDVQLTTMMTAKTDKEDKS